MKALTKEEIVEIKKLMEEQPPLDEVNGLDILSGLFEELDLIKHCVLVLNEDIKEIREKMGLESS